jgi:hypothetical protein
MNASKSLSVEAVSGAPAAAGGARVVLGTVSGLGFCLAKADGAEEEAVSAGSSI